MPLRILPVLLEIGLVIYCLIDCLQASSRDIRTLPKWAWILLILLLPVVGAVAWLIAGRPHRGRHGRTRSGPIRRRSEPPPTLRTGIPMAWDTTSTIGPDGNPLPPGPIGPDDDDEFIERLRREQEWRRQQQRGADPDFPD